MLPRVGTRPGGVIRGKSISAFILTLFGAVWFWLAALNSGRPVVSSAIMIALGTVMLMICSSRLSRTARVFPQPSRPKDVGRVFLYVNVAQWLIGGAAIVGLARAGAEEWGPAVIALVVGLHFFPLAYMFRSPVQYLTGTALVASAVIFNRNYMPVFISSGSILWLTASVQLNEGFRIARHAANPTG